MSKGKSFGEALIKGFIRSAVNQVGRDGGKVVSNRVYKGEHATPIYNVTDRFNNSDNSYNLLESDNIENKKQVIKNPNVILVILGGILIQLIPILGTLIVLINSIYLLLKRKIPVYVTVPYNKTDGRYKAGYRIEYKNVRSNEKKLLSNEQINYNKLKGVYYLISILLFAIIVLVRILQVHYKN